MMKKLVTLLLLLCPLLCAAEDLPVQREGVYEYVLTSEGAVLTYWDYYELPAVPEMVELPAVLGGQPLVGIGENALNTSMGGIESPFILVIPEGVRYVAQDAFLCLHDAAEIRFPATLTEIPEGCFTHVSAALRVAEDNPRYRVEDGFLIDGQTGTLLYDSPDACGKPLPAVRRLGAGCLTNWFDEWGMNVVVPEGVVEIGPYAFYDWEISTLTLPESLRLIETAAFECVTISSMALRLPDGVERAEFGAFGLYSYADEDLLVDVGPATYLETAGEYDARMGEVYWSGEDELNAPLYRQGAYTFRLADAGAVLDAWQPAEISGEALTLILPDRLGGQPLVGLDYCALTQTSCYDDVTLVLPEGLRWLDAYALADCWPVSSLYLPSTLESIPEGSLYALSAEVTLHPDNPHFSNADGFLIDIKTDTLLYTSPVAQGKSLPAVHRLGEACTSNWIGDWYEMDVAIPEGVAEIGSFAFYDCGVKSLTLPESLRLIETSAFEAFDAETLPILIPAGVEWLQFGAFGVSYQEGEWGLYEDPDMIVELGESTRCETFEEYLLRTGDAADALD